MRRWSPNLTRAFSTAMRSMAASWCLLRPGARLVDHIKTGDEVEIDTTRATLHNHTTGEDFLLNPLGDIADILKAGNVFEYARQQGLITN